MLGENAVPAPLPPLLSNLLGCSFEKSCVGLGEVGLGWVEANGNFHTKAWHLFTHISLRARTHTRITHLSASAELENEIDPGGVLCVCVCVRSRTRTRTRTHARMCMCVLRVRVSEVPGKCP